MRNILQKSGDFDLIKTVSKRMARISLLFSSVTMTEVDIDQDMIVYEEDIERNGYNFTDGCGGIR